MPSSDNEPREGQLKDDLNFSLNAGYCDELDMLDLSFDDLNSAEDEDISFEGNDQTIMNGQINPKDIACSDDDINSTDLSDYILGTLIVRVVAARDLKAPKGHLLNSKARRRIFQRASSSTYANISFLNHVQRTSSVDEIINPSWTRTEQSLFFDVTLPVAHLAQVEGSDSSNDMEAKSNQENFNIDISTLRPNPLRQILTVSLFHADNDVAASLRKDKQNKSNDHDEFVGFSSIDVTSIITGKTSYIDKWLRLEGLDDIKGSVRIIIEYECAESPPRVGDKVRFTGFVKPTLCPLPISQTFQVEDVLGDETILSYLTPMEHWKCSFRAHRYMLISVERHYTAVERYQDELIELTNKVAHSPAADFLSATIESLPEEGLLFVGLQAAFGGISLLERWTSEGVKVAVDDIVYATNLDGQHTAIVIDDVESIDNDQSILTENVDEDRSLCSDADYSVASGMPCCPISGECMKNPVVAADGHTYDRSSIRRWLKSSNISPLTGTALKNKDLIPNYLLISSFRKGLKSEKNENGQISQF